MFTIEITLKGTPLAMAVQRKEADAAESLYQQIVQALKSGHPEVLELTCDRQPEKKIGILSSQISAVQISDKASATPGRAAGFWAELSQ